MPWMSVGINYGVAAVGPQYSPTLARYNTYKAKDRVTRSPIKTGGELMCPTAATPKLIPTLIQGIGNHLIFCKLIDNHCIVSGCF
jgi:hypothetical protein